MELHCTLTDHELAAKADQIIDELIKSGGKSFTMQVPARPNADADLILSELNNRFKKLKSKYDNILATEDGHESKTENVWQSGYATGHETGYERGKREAQSGAGWVKASEFKTNEPVFRPFRRKREDGVPEYDYGEIYVTEDNGEIFLDINNERSYEPQHFERWKDYEILDESATPAADLAKDYDTLYYIVMPVLNKLRHRTDNDTRMVEMGSDIRDTIHKALADIKKLPSPISSNEPPFLVQSEASPAAGREEDWISVEDRPLIRHDGEFWELTEDGEKEFIAAVPYLDAATDEPKKERWWIRHCYIDGEGFLYVKCDLDTDESVAGWAVSDIIYWRPLPAPPKRKPSHP